MMNTFHDRTAAEFGRDRRAQGEAFVAVKAEAMGAARPAWTAVGAGGLWDERCVVEVQMIAHAPQAEA